MTFHEHKAYLNIGEYTLMMIEVSHLAAMELNENEKVRKILLLLPAKFDLSAKLETCLFEDCDQHDERFVRR